MSAQSVTLAVKSRIGVMDALRKDAGYPSRVPSEYDVAVAGMNYVDERCAEYFHHLFFLNRRRDALKSGLSAVGQTSNAILAATNATTLTMTVVAQAFGLADKLADVVAGTFLYELPPATTMSFVRKLQKAYRDGVAADQANIKTSADAYHRIQGYLELCLPAVIEARLQERVSDAQAIGFPTESGSGVNVVVGSNTSLEEKAATVLSNSRINLPAVVDNEPLDNFKNPYEGRLTVSQIRQIQSALCIKVDGVLGNQTRTAVQDLFLGAGIEPTHSIVADGIFPGDMVLVRKAVAEDADCNNEQSNTPFKIGKLIG